MQTILIIIYVTAMNPSPAEPGKQGEPTPGKNHPTPAEMLLDESGQLRIALMGQIYTLRKTRNDKLILTK